MSKKENQRPLEIFFYAVESMYASIDLLADKLSRQVKKFKDKALSSDKASIRNAEAEEKVEEAVES